jgi:hypothetical protein
MTTEDMERIERTKKGKGFIGFNKNPRKGDFRWPAQRKREDQGRD